MSTQDQPRIGTSYTHQHVSMRCENTLYYKTEPARFSFNDTISAASETRETQKAAYFSSRKPTSRKDREHKRSRA